MVFISLSFNQSVDKNILVIKYDGINYSWSEAIDPANGLLIDSFIFGWNREKLMAKHIELRMPWSQDMDTGCMYIVIVNFGLKTLV